MPTDVSVVIPTHRRPRELAEALTSVLSQTGASIEVFVVDDSAEGSAREVVDGFGDARVTYLRNAHPSGGVPSVVRNLAWPRATGAFVHFLDDDDIAPEGLYAAAKTAFTKHPDVGLVFGRIDPFGTASEEQLQHERRYFAEAGRKASASARFGSKWAFTGRMLFDTALLVCSAGIVRRECVARVGGFDPHIRLFEDADFYARVMRECGAHFLDRIVLRYRIGTSSLLHSPNPSEAQLREQRAGRRRMQTKYRSERGLFEFCALAAFTRTVLRLV